MNSASPSPSKLSELPHSEKSHNQPQIFPQPQNPTQYLPQQIKSIKWEVYFWGFSLPYFLILGFLVGCLFLLHEFIDIRINQTRLDFLNLFSNPHLISYFSAPNHYLPLFGTLFIFFLPPISIIFLFLFRSRMKPTDLATQKELLELKTYYRKNLKFFWLIWTLPLSIFLIWKLFRWTFSYFRKKST